jgi:phosphotransferase system enzyme I (PtsI)
MKEEHRQNVRLKGTSISPGLAIGRAFVYQDILRRDHEQYNIERHQVDEEYEEIMRAIQQVEEELEYSAARIEKELKGELGDIFRAQCVLLRDPSLTQEMRKELEEELVNAEQVVKEVFRRWERRFREQSSTFIGQRADDVRDLGRRLLRTLQGIHANLLENVPEGSAIIARMSNR